jgi:threonyl-tRNA synthetase
MAEAVQELYPGTKVTIGPAIEIFEGQGEDYKVELIRDLMADEGVETVSLYRNGPFEVSILRTLDCRHTKHPAPLSVPCRPSNLSSA